MLKSLRKLTFIWSNIYLVNRLSFVQVTNVTITAKKNKKNNNNKQNKTETLIPVGYKE